MQDGVLAVLYPGAILGLGVVCSLWGEDPHERRRPFGA